MEHKIIGPIENRNQQKARGHLKTKLKETVKGQKETSTQIAM